MKVSKKVLFLVDGVQTVGELREPSEVVAADGSVYPVDSVRFLPPCEPTKIIGVHVNYRGRLQELNRPPHATPTYFLKAVSALNAHLEDVYRPRGCRYLNFEGEVAVIIGKRARNISRDEVADHIAGYSIVNDFGAHDFFDADGNSLLRDKGTDSFAPMGPALVSGWDYRDKSITTTVNGEIVQSGNTDEMLFDVEYMVADLARTITLLPGDVIMSGTPARSRPAEVGDVVSVSVEGLGTLTNRVVESEYELAADFGAQPSGSEQVRRIAYGGDYVAED